MIQVNRLLVADVTFEPLTGLPLSYMFQVSGAAG